MGGKFTQTELTKTEQRVFDFMLETGSITTLQAITEFGNTRLSATIFNLIKKGVNISADWEEVKNRFGEKRRIKKYYIA